MKSESLAALAFLILVSVVLFALFIHGNTKGKKMDNVKMTDARIRALLSQAQPGSPVGRALYRDHYLKSMWWRSFRERAWNHYGGVCDVCGRSVKLHWCNVHHTRYQDASGQSILFREQFSDVRIVHAGRCHVKADRLRHDQTHRH